MLELRSDGQELVIGAGTPEEQTLHLVRKDG